MQRFMVLALAALVGCSSGGTGGGDPLPEFQLGQDPELDAEVAALTAARNQALACVNAEERTNESDVFLALKQGYAANPAPTETFPEYVANLVEPEQAKTDEICDTTLGNASAELLALIERLTAARNRGAECEGLVGSATNEDSLELLKLGYFNQSVLSFPTLTDFAPLYVEDIERLADDACAG